MMNSISNVEFVKELVSSNVTVLKTEEIDQYQIAFELDRNDVHHTLALLKAHGWIQLSYLSAIDWLEENEMEVVYIVFNWEKPVYIQVRCRLDRENPVMNTVLPLFPGCKYYEREAHEFFGIKFPGNPDYEKQLILEEWDDIPPLRKDFDPRAYSDSKFEKRTFPGSHAVTDEEKSRKAKREKRSERATSLRKGGTNL